MKSLERNPCFEGLKPIRDVPKSYATCGIQMCIVLETRIFLRGK